MPINQYNKAKRLLKVYNKISMKVLRKIIIKQIGSDEHRTVRPYIKLMIETKLIKDIGNENFKVNEN